jgi:hypothetical protein
MSKLPSAFTLAKLKKHVTAAADEFEMAVMFYEAWRTAVDDSSLHERLGTSYATNTFRVIMTALRRELLLALTRMWDTPKSALRLHIIADWIRNPQTIAMIAAERGAKIESGMLRSANAVSRASVGVITESVRETLEEKAVAALAIADKYTKGNPGFAALEKLKAVRNERLAHHEIEAISTPDKNTTDEEIEEFYRDNAELISLLLGLANATAYHPEQGAEVYRTYARNFWASVKGERTEGHPFFRPRPIDCA